MPAPSETLLVEFGEWTLRVRPSKGPARRLLLMLHGWTGDENSMWVFARDVPEDIWLLAPRAPYATRPSGYSWRVPAPDRTGKPHLDELRVSAEALMRLIDDYGAREDIPVRTFDVIGFSQGAALTGALALLFPTRITKAGLLSGSVPRGSGTLTPGRPMQDVSFFVAHGSMDEMVSIEHARESVDRLKQAGARVTVCEDEVGHKVSAACLRALQAFLLS